MTAFNIYTGSGRSMILACFMMICLSILSPILLCQEREEGSLRALVMDLHGRPVPNAVAELLAKGETIAKYRATTISDGIVKIPNVIPGDYTLVIDAPGLPRRGIQVRVIAGRETDSGSIFVGVGDCGLPGVICENSRDLRKTYSLPCMTGLRLLRDSSGKLVKVLSEELERRAILKILPEWWRNVPVGSSIEIAIVLDNSGQVLCAAIAEELTGSRREEGLALLTAVKKWRFQPILDNGVPVAAMGFLRIQGPFTARRI